VEKTISRSAATAESPFGSHAQTFSNIKTPRLERIQPVPAVVRAKVRKQPVRTSNVVATIKAVYRPRYVAHFGILVLAGGLVLANSPSYAHSLSVRLLSAQGGMGSLDATATATVAADVAAKSHLLIAADATKAATQLSQQVALPTTDATTLAKPQVVTTAGNAMHQILNYTVSGGDTLSSIAEKFNVTTNTIKWANGLADDGSLSSGQVLTILPVTGVQYTVASGDTPETLAGTYSANAAQIVSYNNAEAKGLVVGAKIIIPDGVNPQVVQVATATVTTVNKSVSATTTNSPQTGSTALTHYAGNFSNSYARGYCTWYVASRRSLPSFWGDAREWYYNAQASGFSVGSKPVAGAVAWTGAGYYGHVAYVESVSGNMVTISEMNATRGWNAVDTQTVPASNFRYIY
jgi:surface antigen